MASSAKTILLTGCNSGIGLVGAKSLYQQGHRLVLVARTLAKAQATKEQLLQQHSPKQPHDIHTFECDMSSMESIRQFGSNLKKELKQDGLDVLCLNAGMCTGRNSKPQYTQDNLEITLATNHFGPFLLTHVLLTDQSIMNSGGRIVITASSVHEGKKCTFGNFEGCRDDNVPFDNLSGSDFHYFDSYAQSKLCNVAFCMQLHKRLVEKNIVVNCFAPGFIPSTGLFQHQNWFLVKVFGFLATSVFGIGTTVQEGGDALTWMATSDTAGKEGGFYFKKPKETTGDENKEDLLTPHPISEEVANEENQTKLWNISAAIVGVESDAI